MSSRVSWLVELIFFYVFIGDLQEWLTWYGPANSTVVACESSSSSVDKDGCIRLFLVHILEYQNISL